MLLAISSFVLFDYGTMARSLSLGVLLFLIVWAFRRHRWVWVAIALLPMVDLLFGMLSIICLCIMSREKRWSWAGAALWLASSLIAAWTVIPAPDIVPALAPQTWRQGLLSFLGYCGQLLMPLPFDGERIVWNRTLPPAVAILCGYGFLWLGWRLTRQVTLHRLLWCGFAVFTLLFSMLVYMLPIRHLSLLALLLIAMEWRARELHHDGSRLFTTWLGCTAACGITLAAINMVKPFDAATQAAHWISRENLTDRHWAALQEEPSSGTAMVNGMMFTALGIDCRQDFIRRNYSVNLGTASKVQTELDRMAEEYGRFYLISARRLPRLPGVAELMHIKPGFDGIPYFLYVVRPELAETDKRPAICAPQRRVQLPAWDPAGYEMRSTLRQQIRAWMGLPAHEIRQLPSR